MAFALVETTGDQLSAGRDQPLDSRRGRRQHGAREIGKDEIVWRTRNRTRVGIGADTLVHGRLGDSTLTVRLPGSTVVRERDRVPLALPADSVHAFDKATGKRL